MVALITVAQKRDSKRDSETQTKHV